MRDERRQPFLRRSLIVTGDDQRRGRDPAGCAPGAVDMRRILRVSILALRSGIKDEHPLPLSLCLTCAYPRAGRLLLLPPTARLRPNRFTPRRAFTAPHPAHIRAGAHHITPPVTNVTYPSCDKGHDR